MDVDVPWRWTRQEGGERGEDEDERGEGEREGDGRVGDEDERGEGEREGGGGWR